MTSRPILPTPLVSTDWLAKHLGDPDLRVLDAIAHLAGPESASTGWSLRPRRDDYLAAHIPGAAFADIIDDLSEPDGGALSKPSPARFAAAAGRLGIGPLSRVVVYAPRELLGWQPTHPGLIDDLGEGHYFHSRPAQSAEPEGYHGGTS
jgi:thiosulfate/3-mercaptopyruvate sulfurtransferase